MHKIQYNKPALSIEKQIKLLKKRNLIIEEDDIKDIEKFLMFKNYYRISPYWKTMDCNNHIIKGEVSFKQIKARYSVDHSLIVSILEALKVIEVGLKTQFAYLSTKYNDPYFYLKSENFKNTADHSRQLSIIRKELQRSKSDFIKHYLDKYVIDEPPVWAMVEVLSFGTMVKLLSMLKNQDKEIIANNFNLNSRFFYGSVNVFYILRNLTAHHTVLFNQNLKLTLHKNNTSSYTDFENVANLEDKQKKKIYNWLVLILYFLKESGLESSFKGKVLNIIKKIPEKDYFFYGIPKDFKEKLKEI
jgi:abortive infection bacteriophage resistance protein